MHFILVWWGNFFPVFIFYQLFKRIKFDEQEFAFEVSSQGEHSFGWDYIVTVWYLLYCFYTVLDIDSMLFLVVARWPKNSIFKYAFRSLQLPYHSSMKAPQKGIMHIFLPLDFFKKKLNCKILLIWIGLEVGKQNKKNTLPKIIFFAAT